jgi:uncharacterized membrane protein
MAVDNSQNSALSHVQEHIDLIARLEQDFLDERTQTEKFGDRIASSIGSFPFVGAHIVICAAWVLWNTFRLNPADHFDPFPYPFLDLVLAFEGILVASFILMRQSRMARRGEERDQLMLQLLLLSEREITAVLGLEREIAAKMGLHDIAADEEINQLSQQTAVDEVVQSIKDNLPKEV